MKVTVKVYYYEVFGKGLIELNMSDHATIKDLLNLLDQKFGLKFREKTGISLKEALKRRFNLFLNGEYLDLKSSLDRILNDGDRLTILRPVGGGFKALR